MKPLPLVYAILFAVAHTQSHVPYSNQNQYLLKGVADASDSPLRHDWLTATADPTPVFSAVVQLSYSLGGEWLLQALFFAALVGYFLAVWRLPFVPKSAWFALAFTAVHAGPVRWASDRLFRADYVWFLQSGLANQYLLGPGLQPSVIGVLLLWSVAEWANDRPIRAAVLAASSTLVHSTYLLPAAMLVAGFCTQLLIERRWKAAGWSVLAAGSLVLPSIAYTLATFAPTDPATFAESQRILAEVRIPHHCRPARWFDWAAGAQVVWKLVGLVLLRRTRLFVPLLVVAGLVAVGTLAVVVTENPTLSLLFPWRVTAVLVPVCTAAVVGRLYGSPRGGDESAGVGALVSASRLTFLLFALTSAALVYAVGLGYREPTTEADLLAHVAATRPAEHLYLIPARFPGPPKSPGVYSKTFSQPDPAFSDLARFRLATHARLFVDFKAIPYRDVEVLEWHRRVSACERWFKETDWETSGIIDEVAAEGITHVIAPSGKPLKSVRLEEEYADAAYRVYRVRPGG